MVLISRLIVGDLFYITVTTYSSYTFAFVVADVPQVAIYGVRHCVLLLCMSSLVDDVSLSILLTPRYFSTIASNLAETIVVLFCANLHVVLSGLLWDLMASL